jgi:hypothetical protein
MQPILVPVEKVSGAEAAAVADKRGPSLSPFSAEPVAAALREHERQRALQRIEEEVMGTGAPVSRDEFDEAQRPLRGDDSRR